MEREKVRKTKNERKGRKVLTNGESHLAIP
jgi:hypothetical protein